MPDQTKPTKPHYRYADAGTQPWDKRDDESHDAFIAFAFFRDMGPNRSLRSAWYALNPQAKSMNQTFFKWSKNYGWQARAKAFDIWRGDLERAKLKEWEESQGRKLERNRDQQRKNEMTLGVKAMQKADEILSLPLIRHSFTSQQGGVLQVHKTFLQSPAHLMAATALMKHGSDMARRGLGLTDESDDDITPDRLKSLLYRTQERIAKDMPPGALPAPLSEEPAPAGEDAAVDPAAVAAARIMSPPPGVPEPAQGKLDPTLTKPPRVRP